MWGRRTVPAAPSEGRLQIMGFIYTEEQESIRELVRDFAKNELEPRAAEMDRNEKLDPEIIKMMGEMGLMGIGIPEEYGGLGLGMMEKSIVVEELARKCASTAELISRSRTWLTWRSSSTAPRSSSRNI